MIILKSERDMEAMRPACAVASAVLDEVSTFIQPGVTTGSAMSVMSAVLFSASLWQEHVKTRLAAKATSSLK